MKTGKLLVALFFMAVVLATFAQADIASVKNEYLTTETVYIRSTALLCNNQPKDTIVNLYIVENMDEWVDGDFLDDVRGDPQEVLNSQFPSKKIWENPKAGFYDVLVDCIENGDYDSLEPIDSLSATGFTVTAVTGTSRASVGSNDMGDHIWRHDPENPKFTNEMLQMKLVASNEDIILENMTIKAAGTGDDIKIVKVEIYADENNDGKVSENELLIADAEPAYDEDNGEISLSLDYVLTRDLTENLLIVYEMQERMVEGEFSLIVESIYGIGENSGEIIEFSGLPMTSGIKTVLPEKTCLGELSLDLAPNPAFEEGIVTADLSGLTGCSNKTIVLRLNPCGSSIKEEVGSCIIEGEGCQITFPAEISKTFHACIDKNDDEDMVDFGEYAIEDLIVEEKPTVVKDQNLTEEVNITDEITTDEDTTVSEITGDVIEELKSDLSEAGSFFILLEITLLLILFVLVMIMFRLKPRTVQKEEEETEED
jgi:hypothetical protein